MVSLLLSLLFLPASLFLGLPLLLEFSLSLTFRFLFTTLLFFDLPLFLLGLLVQLRFIDHHGFYSQLWYR